MIVNRSAVIAVTIGLGLGALAVHPHLAFSDDALDMTERQAGKARFEEAVDAHAVLIGGDGRGLDTCCTPSRLRGEFDRRSKARAFG